MSKDIWHTKKEKATEDKLVFAQHKSLIRDSGVDWFIWEPQEFTDATREDVIAWTYLADLLALETELKRTRKALEISVDAMTQCSSMRGVELIETINAALAKIKDTIEQKE